MREKVWLAAFREASRQGVSLIFTFAPERTERPQFVQDTIDAVGSHGGRPILIELTCANDELESRLEDTSRRKFGKLRSVEQYRASKDAGAFNFPAPPKPEISLDTTHSSPVVTAELINRYISKFTEFA